MNATDRFEPFLKPALHTRLPRYLRGEAVYPVNVEVAITDRCDATCPFCFYVGGGRRGDIEKPLMLDALADMAACGVKAVTWTGGGEPTLHRDFPVFTETATRLRLRQGLFTNALRTPRYDPTLFDWIRVSRTRAKDGTVRPFDTEALRALRRCRTLGLCVNYTGDDADVQDALHVADKVGADYVQVRPALAPRGGTVDYQTPAVAHEKLIVADYKFNAARRRGRGYAVCEGYHFVPFVWPDGEVNVCAYRRGVEGYTLGNLRDRGFATIMYDAPTSVPVAHDCQVCCKNHELNCLVARLRRIEDKDFV